MSFRLKKTPAQKELLRRYNMIPLFWKVISETVANNHRRIMVANILTGEVIYIED